MVYSTLRSTLGGINTIKYLYICMLSGVVYDFYSNIIELVSILLRFKIKIPQRWYLPNNMIVFSYNTTLYTTVDNIQYLSSPIGLKLHRLRSW